MRLVQVSLSARKHLESSFHGCGRPVKFVQASISDRKYQFMSTKDLESIFHHCEGPVKLYVEWGSTNTAGTSMFKISHIHKV